jgi:uncharacterized protein YkwD
MSDQSSVLRRLVWPLTLLLASSAVASEEAQLLASINQYRNEVQRCGQQVSEELPPLLADGRLQLAARGVGDLQRSLSTVGYPMVNAQAITLSGPRDAQAALQVLTESFCQILLDPQFADIGISQLQRDWRIVLARPLLGRMGDWQVEGEKLLQQINAARAQARQCAAQSFSAAQPLVWNPMLAVAAESHSRSMANHNYFAHQDRDGRTPGDRAELAGYSGQRVGENIAAGQDTVVRIVEGWLASPSHCANLMSPQFTELGAAYAVDPKSDAGIYWAALFGSP